LSSCGCAMPEVPTPTLIHLASQSVMQTLSFPYRRCYEPAAPNVP